MRQGQPAGRPAVRAEVRHGPAVPAAPPAPVHPATGPVAAER
ncbi:hypothetical protein F750_1821 [Streptomyces sp. PAMC 26508]|nr:hypothetical protein F750_1821 [Streptomyces sp. PAMC 26508]